MKVRRASGSIASAGNLRRFAVLLVAMPAILIAAPAAALAENAASELSVTINRGETYLIKGGSPSSQPQVSAVDNPRALIVHEQPSGDVLVLGAEAGVETVRVTMADGRVATYNFTVRALSEPGRPLEPGVAPAATGEPLDTGAGPVQTAGSAAEPSPAAAKVAPANASASETPPAAPVAPEQFTAKQQPAAPSDMSSNPPLVSSQVSAPKFVTNPSAMQRDGDGFARGRGNLPDDTISMQFGTSRVFDFPERIKRVSIAASDIADLQVIDPHQLMLIGRKPGFTTLAVWDDQGHYEERQVHIEQSGHQQVMLSVLVAEIDRTRIENQGVDYSAALTHSGISLSGLPGQVATPYSASSVITGTGTSNGGLLPSGGSIIPLLLSNNLTYALAAQNSAIQTQSFFRYLEQNSLARVLAQPQLVANSGEQAKFLSGGEIPIIIAQALNTSIVFKQFGTSVLFVPTVIGKSQLELLVKPEVSKPDFTQGVSLFGFTVPAFITQRAETVVRMNEGQTLIIAGLILRDRKAVVSKIPYLGDIPWAGGLFRNTDYQNSKTELVMTVTPRIVRPIPAEAEVAYPMTDRMTSEELETRRLKVPDPSRPRF